MGTRNLIEVKIDGQLKVAQYGQWDGYPTGQGKGIAEFLHNTMNEEEFKAALRECKWIDEKQAAIVNAECPNGDWKTKYPWLSRDAGSKVLGYIQNDGARYLLDDSDYKNVTTGFTCEYHYLIDMDNGTVSMNGREPIPFSEWTAEKMEELKQAESQDAA
jgi:hypothetical protein